MDSATTRFLTALRNGCSTCRLAKTRVLVAVSGGADSVSMLLGLRQLQDELGLTLHAAHLNHQLRGAASDADAMWVADLCGKLAIPCDVGRGSVSDAPERTKLGLEGAARVVRRRFLQRIATEQQCAGIAIAHTVDDQAETILHHILRGTGLAGLRGMHADAMLSEELVFESQATRPLVRPLLQIERATLIAYLAEQQQPYREDATNADTTLTRNRIRHDLLPLLARQFNPQIQQALLRLGQQASEAYADIETRSAELLTAATIEITATHCRLRCAPFAGQPLQLIRESFVLLWRKLDWPRRQMGFDDWDRVVQMLQPQSSPITLPGNITVRRREDLLMLIRNQK